MTMNNLRPASAVPTHETAFLDSEKCPSGYLTVTETARLFRCSISVVDWLIDYGKIRAAGIGASRFIPFSSIRHLMLSTPARGVASRPIRDMPPADDIPHDYVAYAINFFAEEFRMHKIPMIF